MNAFFATSEAFHIHNCPNCKTEIWHDGDSCGQAPEMLCSECRPYIYEDLVIKGECRPIGNVLAFALPYCVGYFMGIATMLVVWWITK